MALNKICHSLKEANNKIKEAMLVKIHNKDHKVQLTNNINIENKIQLTNIHLK